jgi:hypothetical protein
LAERILRSEETGVCQIGRLAQANLPSELTPALCTETLCSGTQIAGINKRNVYRKIPGTETVRELKSK